VTLWQRAAGASRHDHPALAGEPFRTAVVRQLLADQVNELLDETARRLSDARVRSVADVRAAKGPLVGFGPETGRLKGELEQFLRDRVYRHHRVLRMTASGKRILKALFAEYVTNPELLPERHLSRWAGAERVGGAPPLPGRRPVAEVERVVGDYLAGMTDRFAQQEYRRLFSPTTDL
jgi:dGTPase